MDQPPERGTITDAEARAVLETALKATGEGIVAIDQKSIIVAANDTLAEMWGYTRTELIGQPIQKFMPLRYRKDHTAGVRRFVEQNKPDTSGKWNEAEALHKDGHEVPIFVRIRRVQHEGRFLLAAAIRDATHVVHLRTALAEGIRLAGDGEVAHYFEEAMHEIEHLDYPPMSEGE